MTQRQLIDYALRWREWPFSAGEADCAQFVRGWLIEVTGIDPVEGLDVAEYASERKGLLALRVAGFASLGDFAASVLPEIHPVYAVCGDVVIIETERGDALALCAGEIVYAVNDSGLAVVPKTVVKRAFRCQA